MHPSRSFIGMDRRFDDSKVTSLERSIFSTVSVVAFNIDLKTQT